ncbi:NADH-quinone oxidoreductase subunit NuoH [Lignipirellula cremea]|uniref:NADH-quinone oxidoreductase subunit H n=1 Tax=Lignipirellula cremea TaxID=2528010 RepID=A0A518DQU6_9BACT|nr:NADH-quinone oxidoreductase subunit NuoH [Lignipirellula cremea]QDU94211.1 NADH-quinone oxidoreductase subunit 8 [Lignipirellula cremea]
MSATLIAALIKIAILIGGLMTAAAYLVLLERRIAAWIQDRRGPNRVGIPLTKVRVWGFGQPLADGVKFILKEEYTPAHVDKRLYVLAPVMILAAALAVFAVIPFGGVIAPLWEGMDPIPLVVAPTMNVGVLYVFALSSLAVYGVILGGWASNNKYSFLGGLRSSAQLIAYELPLGLGLLGVVLACGSLDLDTIILRQAETGVWLAFAQPLGLIVFTIAAFAEAARLPFDLPECEQELIGGYHTEYSGIKLLLFLVAEFLHMITAAFLIVILFFGGWHLWGMPAEQEVSWYVALARAVILSTKVLAVIVFFMVVRWSWPRFRFDQLMALAWKVMLPLGLVNLAAVAIFQELQLHFNPDGGLPLKLAFILASWGVCAAAWTAVAIAGPLVTDNRARRDIEPLET